MSAHTTPPGTPPDTPPDAQPKAGASGQPTSLRPAASRRGWLATAGLGALMAQYLRVFEGAASLTAHPDLEFLAALQLLANASRVSNT